LSILGKYFTTDPKTQNIKENDKLGACLEQFNSGEHGKQSKVYHGANEKKP
jgi:hypothetical protein